MRAASWMSTAEFSGRVAARAAGGGDDAEAALDEREKEPENCGTRQSLRLSALTSTPSSSEGRVRIRAALSDDAEPELATRRKAERASACRGTPKLTGSCCARAGMVLGLAAGLGLAWSAVRGAFVSF